MADWKLSVTGSLEHGVREAHTMFMEKNEPVVLMVTPPGTTESYTVEFAALRAMWQQMGLSTAACSTGTCG